MYQTQVINNTYVPPHIRGLIDIREEINLPKNATIYNPIQQTSIDLAKYEETKMFLEEHEKDTLEKVVDAVGTAFLSVVIGVVVGKSN